jgi:ribosomal protein S18 acetylase RimI-like enzyme
MSNVKILDVNKGDPYLDEVVPLFIDLYKYMKESGMLMPLADEGHAKWRASLDNMVGGRFGVVKVALHNNKVVGFIQGLIRYSPDYLGSLKVGYLTHIYIKPEYRGESVGQRMVDDLSDWFKSKNVHSIELQVLCGNISGIKFWESLGYKKELLQMRKEL